MAAERIDVLAPCPFCGSELVSLSNGETGDGQPWLYVECEGCAATATPEMWNVRCTHSKGAPSSGWLWGRLMDWCRARRYAPAEFDDLFAIAVGASARDAAVAELIEAAKLARSYMEHVEWCSEITNGIDGDCDCGHELHRERVNAALARMGEGA